jgi:hypothetical protein
MKTRRAFSFPDLDEIVCLDDGVPPVVLVVEEETAHQQPKHGGEASPLHRKEEQP